MRRLHTEYLLKGVFLGLLAYTALQHPDWPKTGMLAAFLAGGLGVGLLLALFTWLPRGIHVGGRILSLFLFLLLESPTLIYAGSIGGLLAGALWVRDPARSDSLLPICIGGGALVGLAIGEARRVRSANWRSSAAAAVACILVGVAIYYIEKDADLNIEVNSWQRFQFGVHLLLGLPFFYLLTFAGRAEESEGEFAALCAGLAVGLWLANPVPNLPSLALVIPAGLYAMYTRQVMPKLRVFKHTLRGYSYAQMRRVRPALTSFRRALELDPNNSMALAGLARVHSTIDPRQLVGDAETIALLDLDLCLNRAARLLFEPSPGQSQLEEVRHLLELVAAQRPERLPEVEYWRAVADMRQRRPDAAADRLGRLLDPSAWSPADLSSRSEVLFPAWQMALMRSADLAGRVGKIQLGLPVRRMEAIAAAEKALAGNPQDTEAWELKRRLYDGLTWDAYESRRPVEGEFDGGYARELGLTLLNDAGRWRRGIEYLKMAADFLPQHAPTIYSQMAQAFERVGETHHAKACYDYLKEVGLAYGPRNLPPAEKDVFFNIVKRSADDAAARGDQREAIKNLKMFTESEHSGIETYRQLAEMHEKLGEALGALHFNDVGLIYNARDRDLLARKDRYYYSVMPDQVRQLPDDARSKLDADYCLNKAREILSSRQLDLDGVDWALHLIELARVIRPDWLEPKLLWARGMLWKGEKDKALQMLEDVREAKPAKFVGPNDEDAWYRCNQVLGDLYLNEFTRPDLAIPCYLEFRESHKSGADTLFKLGQAYEALGDVPRAVKFYETVTSYTEHPRYYEAEQAVRRLKQGGVAGDG